MKKGARSIKSEGNENRRMIKKTGYEKEMW